MSVITFLKRQALANQKKQNAALIRAKALVRRTKGIQLQQCHFEVNISATSLNGGGKQVAVRQRGDLKEAMAQASDQFRKHYPEYAGQPTCRVTVRLSGKSGATFELPEKYWLPFKGICK